MHVVCYFVTLKACENDDPVPIESIQRVLVVIAEMMLNIYHTTVYVIDSKKPDFDIRNYYTRPINVHKSNCGQNKDRNKYENLKRKVDGTMVVMMSTKVEVRPYFSVSIINNCLV